MPDASGKPTVGDLRRSIEAENATWKVDERLSDDDLLPSFLPGTTEELVRQLLAFREWLRVPDSFPTLSALDASIEEIGPPNAYLAEVWYQEGLISRQQRERFGPSTPGPLQDSSQDQRPPSEA
jgi:hypothetical protein